MRLFALLRTARVTTFFLSLASTNPPLSELGRSFRPFPLKRRFSSLPGGPPKGSVVIPLKSSYRTPLRKSLRVAGSSRFRSCFQAFRRRAFHPVAVLACREVYQFPASCQFFSICFFDHISLHSKTSLPNLHKKNMLCFFHASSPALIFFEPFRLSSLSSSSQRILPLHSAAPLAKEGEGIFAETSGKEGSYISKVQNASCQGLHVPFFPTRRISPAPGTPPSFPILKFHSPSIFQTRELDK